MKKIYEFIINPEGKTSEKRYINLIYFSVRFITIFLILYIVWLLAGNLYLRIPLKVYSNTYLKIDDRYKNFNYDIKDKELLISYSDLSGQSISRIRIKSSGKIHINQVLIIALFLSVSGFPIRRKLINAALGFVIMLLIHIFYISQVFEKQKMMYIQKSSSESFVNFYDSFGFWFIPLLIWGIVIYFYKRKSIYIRNLK